MSEKSLSHEEHPDTPKEIVKKQECPHTEYDPRMPISARAEDVFAHAMFSWSEEHGEVHYYRDPVSGRLYGDAKDGSMHLFDSGNDSRVIESETEEGKHVRMMLTFLKERDRFIEELRQKKAHDFAGGDSVLENILRLHLDHNGGHDPSGRLLDEITFYPCGSNASHEFYLGTKDGKIFRYAESGDEHYLYEVFGDVTKTQWDRMNETEQKSIIDHLLFELENQYKEDHPYAFLSDEQKVEMQKQQLAFQKSIRLSLGLESESTALAESEDQVFHEQEVVSIEELREFLLLQIQAMIDAYFDPANTEQYFEITFPDGMIFQFRRKNSPVEVKGETYLGRSGFFVQTDQLHTPADSLTIIDEENS